MAKKSSGGRVTPTGTGTTSAAPRQSARPKILAIVLIVLVLAGLVAGAVGSMIGGGTTTTQVPVTAPPG